MRTAAQAREAAPPGPSPPRASAKPPPVPSLVGNFAMQRMVQPAAEHAADEAAEHGIRGPLRAIDSGAAPDVPSFVRDALRSGGQSLDTVTRASMESRLAHDFGDVRIHTAPSASRSAAAIGAQAYTVGTDVVFAAGRFAPATADGGRLLAHELTHVVQQRRSGRMLQCKPETKPPAGVTFHYSVRVGKPLNSDQLLLVFIRQYRDLSSDDEAVAVRDREKWVWQTKPIEATQADVKKGYVLISVTDSSLTPSTGEEKKELGKYFKGLAPADQSAINTETDQRFWDKTKYKPGQKLGTSADDKKMSPYWTILRDKLLADRQKIDALPPAIRTFLFDENAATAVEPKDYETVLRIAAKIAGLDPTALAEYKSRVTSTTTDWHEFEGAVDQFLGEWQAREAVTRDRHEVESKLFRLKELYRRYRMLRQLQSNAATLGASATPMGVGAALGSQPTINDERTQLNADLITAGFPGGISDFEKLIRQYGELFDRETRALAKVMLDQYEHQLWTEEQKYQKPGASEALHSAVAPARPHYEEAEKIRSEHASSVVMSMDEMAEQAYWVGKRNEALGRGEAAMGVAAVQHPLLANRDFDRDRLARASVGETKPQMLDYIAARKKDIGETRKNLAEKPGMIFGLDELLKASMAAQKLTSGSIYEMIVQDHIRDEAWKEAIPGLILAVVAIALAFLTGGTGAVAVLATAGVFGIGAYQVLDEYRRYEQSQAAYGAKLLSDDPTFAWVIVAVVGAGLDAAALGAALKAVKFREALGAFRQGPKAGDLAVLTAELEAIPEVPQAMRGVILANAAKRKEMIAAWKAVVFLPDVGLRAAIPFAERLGRMLYAVYLSARQGIREFQLFVKTDEFISLFGDVAKLTEEELVLVKGAFSQSVKDMEKIAAHGKSLNLADGEIEAFMNLRAQTKQSPLDDMLREMSAWKATGQAELPAKALGKSTLVIDENVVIVLRKRAAGEALRPEEEALWNRFKDLDQSDLRAPAAVRAKGTAIEAYNITVSRESAEYKDVLKILDDYKVGQTKGAEDRQIVADLFFAKTEPGVTPVLVTQDGGIVKRLYAVAKKDANAPRLLGKPVKEALKDGFEVPIGTRKIKVIPLPGL